MADFNVSVTKNGVIPAVIVAGNEQTYGQTILFEFSSDWDDLTKEVIFYDLRGNTVISWVADGVEVFIPDTVAQYGGDSKFTIRGYTVDAGYIADQLQVTGTIHYTYTAGNNPRMEGKIIPSTLEQFIDTASRYVDTKLQEAKDSGEFDGADGADGAPGQNGTAAGFGTPTASAVSLSQDDDPTVTVTASGSDTEKVFAFTFGIPKSVGKNFTILGHYASLQALQAAVPNPAVGDAYSVGASTPYNIYVYDGVTHAWANYGTLGSGGGSTITVDTAMSNSSTNAVQNKTIKEYVDLVNARIPFALTIFGTEYDGSSAVTVTMDTAMSDSSDNAVKNKTIKAYVDGLIGDIDTAITAINTLIGTPSE